MADRKPKRRKPRRKRKLVEPIQPNDIPYSKYRIEWIDITGDAGHATAQEFDKFECATMITFAYVYKKTKKFIWTFSSFDTKDEVFSDRNIIPMGCITKMEKLNV